MPKLKIDQKYEEKLFNLIQSRFLALSGNIDKIILLDSLSSPKNNQSDYSYITNNQSASADIACFRIPS